jgi:hypothetical protein
MGARASPSYATLTIDTDMQIHWLLHCYWHHLCTSNRMYRLYIGNHSLLRLCHWRMHLLVSVLKRPRIPNADSVIQLSDQSSFLRQSIPRRQLHLQLRYQEAYYHLLPLWDRRFRCYALSCTYNQFSADRDYYLLYPLNIDVVVCVVSVLDISASNLAVFKHIYKRFHTCTGSKRFYGQLSRIDYWCHRRCGGWFNPLVGTSLHRLEVLEASQVGCRESA